MRKVAQILGLPSNSKLLIVHADDLGMCHSVNRATLSALEMGRVTSASVMVPCPAFSEAARWAALHNDYDIGVHSTLISEWKNYRWGPVSAGPHSAEMVDVTGHFWPKNSLLRAVPEEIETEITAQIMAARNSGIKPTHLDSHMLSVARPEYLNPYIHTARKFSLPFLIDKYWHSFASSQGYGAAADLVIDNLIQANAGLSLDDLEDYYILALRELKAGLNQLIVHLGFDDEELRNITGDCHSYGAAWRQRDFDIVTSQRFRSTIRENRIHLVNWGMIGSVNRASAPLPTASRAV